MKKTDTKTNLAAIDIGSNAVRLLIKSHTFGPTGQHVLNKLLLLRVPLRLGFDVFAEGEISKPKVRKMRLLIKSFRHLMNIYGVGLYRACATSAMRDAANGRRVMRGVAQDVGIDIEIIDGKEEAQIIYSNHAECLEDRSGNHLYVDVGGGSTEINLLAGGELCASASYNLGTVRILQGAVKAGTWEHMAQQLAQFTDGLGPVNIIGTGGNINKLYKLAQRKDRKLKLLPVNELARLHQSLARLSVEERMEAYDLKADRADVIVPAAEIFLRIAATVRAEHIHVPVIGLADGIIDGLCAQLTAPDGQEP